MAEHLEERRVEQRYREHAMSMDANGNYTEIEVIFIAFGAEDETDALAMVKEESPEDWNELPRKSFEITERLGDRCFSVTVNYADLGKESDSYREGDAEPDEDPTVSFDCGGGTMHMTHSHDQRVAFGDKKAGGAIGWNGKTGAEMAITGIDVPTAQLRETYTRIMKLSRITTSFKKKVAKLVGKVNSGSFKGWSKGEVMFLGMSYSSPNRKGALVNVIFNFAVQPNEDVTICGKKISKKGFEYVWALSKTEIEDGVPRAKVDAIYVDEVCRSGDFSVLGL